MCMYFLAIVHFQNNILTFCSLLYCFHRHKMFLDTFGKIESCILFFLTPNVLPFKKLKVLQRIRNSAPEKYAQISKRNHRLSQCLEQFHYANVFKSFDYRNFFRSLTVPQSNQTPNNSQVKRFNQFPLNYITALCSQLKSIFFSFHVTLNGKSVELLSA